MHTFLTRLATSTILAILFCVTFFVLPPLFFSFVLITILGIILFFEWPLLFNIRKLPCWLFFLLYPGLPFTLIFVLNHSVYRTLIAAAILLVFSFDIGAYCIGSLFGRHIIAPRISSGKTWEGALGGALFSYGALHALLWFHGVSMPFTHRIIFSSIVCTLALVGDLFESKLKRRAGIKDSGTLLPGHGGFLDRIDSLLFVIPFFFLFREYLTSILGLS